MDKARALPVPPPPPGTDRWLWFKTSGLTHDEWEQQFAAEFIWAEAVQYAYYKGKQDESDEHRQREIEQKKRQTAAKPNTREAASLERLKKRQGG